MADLVSVGTEHYPPLSRFLAEFEDEVRGPDFWLARFQLWWDRNPAFRDGCPRGWMLCENERIVGFIGRVPSSFYLHGRESVACSATTWRVLRANRGKSLKLLGALVAAERDSVLFDTTATDEVVPIIESFGFRRFPPAGQRRSIIVLEPSAVVRARFSAGRLVAGVAPVTGLLWRGAQLVMTGLRRRHSLSFGEMTSADERFDELWERTRTLYPNTNVRNAVAVNWHCFTSPHFRKTVVGAFEGTRLHGYAVCSQLVRDGLRVLDVVDVWFDPRAEDVLPALVAGLESVGRQIRCDVVQISHFGSDLASALQACGLVEIVRAPVPGYLKTSDEEYARIVAEGFYLTHLQGDYLL